jgi:NAD(P)-dependent dehydrogenase (short-subunit alcohol dehydrogenase family)
MAWTANDIPDLRGKTALVTGANSGLGFATALELARHGAEVHLACRDRIKAEAAASSIRAEVPNAALALVDLDLADLSSVGTAAAAFRERCEGLHLLVNNAGVMAVPHLKTADGFELQLGVNYLGHFALTGLLLDRLSRAGGARVVAVSSLMHRFGRIRFDDLHAERRRYGRWSAYCQSKLANLMFTLELHRRLEAASIDIVAAAAHPGYAATELQAAGARIGGSRLEAAIMRLGNRFLGQPAARGALPTLYAATAPDVRSGDFFGPGGFAALRGAPKKAAPSARALDAEAASRLWAASLEATGVTFPF